jgi:hypothetical protein
MPHLLKPAFEQFRHEAIKSGKPLLEKNVVPIQAAIVAELEKLDDLLIQKTRRLPHPEGMVEISAKWFGLNSDQWDLVKTLRGHWNEEVLGEGECAFNVGQSDEAVLLMFAVKYPEDRYLTGKMLITF